MPHVFWVEGLNYSNWSGFPIVGGNTSEIVRYQELSPKQVLMIPNVKIDR